MGAAAVPMMLMTLVSTGVSVYGQMQEAKVSKATAEFNAKVAENEALTAQMEGMEQARRTRRDAKSRQARLRSITAKAGVDTGQGSPLLAAAEQAGREELAALDMERGTMIESRRFKSQASIERFEGKSRARAAKIGAGVSLLRGATSMVQAKPR